MKGYSSIAIIMLFGSLTASILFTPKHVSEVPESKKMQIKIIRRQPQVQLAKLKSQVPLRIAPVAQRITRQTFARPLLSSYNRIVAGRRTQDVQEETPYVTAEHNTEATVDANATVEVQSEVHATSEVETVVEAELEAAIEHEHNGEVVISDELAHELSLIHI